VKPTIIFPRPKGMATLTGSPGLAGRTQPGPAERRAGSSSFSKPEQGDLGDPGANPVIPPDPSTGWTWRVSSPTSLDLPSTRIKPTWWDDSPDNGESIEARSVSVVWACCPNQCPTPWSKIVVLPGPVTN